MPAPTAEQIEELAANAVAAAGILGSSASDLAAALAQATAEGLELFLDRARVLPGILASPIDPKNPTSGNAVTIGPGLLMPPPFGAPLLSELESAARTALYQHGLRGEFASDLAAVLAGTLLHAMILYTVQVTVEPGIAIKRFETAQPGRLRSLTGS